VPSVDIDEANREIFSKTLSFYCTLITRGCYGLCQALDMDSEAEVSTAWLPIQLPIDSRSKVEDTCQGKIILVFDENGTPIVKYVIPLHTEIFQRNTHSVLAQMSALSQRAVWSPFPSKCYRVQYSIFGCPSQR